MYSIIEILASHMNIYYKKFNYFINKLTNKNQILKSMLAYIETHAKQFKIIIDIS
jgi:hypothetical protein